LQKWFIHCRLLGFPDGAVTTVTDDADNFGRICLGRSAWEQDLAADGINARQIAGRELLVDDQDRRRSRSIVHRELAPSRQRDAHCGKIVGTYEVDLVLLSERFPICGPEKVHFA